MAVSKIIAPNLNEGIDRKTLKELKERFMKVNQGRLDRTKSALSIRQQRFFEVLPLLLHVNHPLLPGYNNSSTPAIISDYRPDRNTLRQAQCLTRSFKYVHRPKAMASIYSIFLMGSTGTIAHSESSDMDIWVVYRPELNQSEIDDLRIKLDNISEWAKTIGMEVYFFLMDPISFKQGERQSLEGEDCGSAQHYLLLDEFYRTALLVAGRCPLWWLIPPYDEHDYDAIADTLLNKRFVRQKEIIDFGGVAELPAGEFIGAGMWHLYKGVDSAYKSVLKICLTEIYAAEFPNVISLSHLFKQSIYNNHVNLDELDPYIMVYRKIENYLKQNGEEQRLELIRRCLYFKINIPMGKSTNPNRKSWRWHLLKKLISEWHWDQALLNRLDSRPQWKVNQVFTERNALVNQLTYSYRFLADFASNHSDSITINHKDMIVLGRKLYAAFERKGGKVELINPGIAPNIIEENLSFYTTKIIKNNTEITGWICYTGHVSPDNKENSKPLKRAESVIEILIWAYFNGLIDANTRYYLEPNRSDLSEQEIHRTTQSFLRLLPKKMLESGHDQFHKPAAATHITLYLNVGFDPLREKTKRGINVLTNHTDALRYSALHSNLVNTVDQVSVNSWGEILTAKYSGQYAILDCLMDYLNSLVNREAEQPPELNICCFCASRNSLISIRIEELFRDTTNFYFKKANPLSSRYILEIDEHFFVIQFQEDNAFYRKFDRLIKLRDYLGEPQTQYSPIALDNYANTDNTIRQISGFFTSDAIQVFYLLSNEIEIYVSDFSGALFYCKSPLCDEDILLSHLHKFISASLFRTTTERPNTSLSSPRQRVRYYRINPKKKKNNIERKALDWEMPVKTYYNVQAIADYDSSGSIHFTIYCDHKEFSQLEFGDKIYQAVAEHILDHRTPENHYPCYLTDLDLSRIVDNPQNQALTQLSQLFRYKHKIEKEINSALNRKPNNPD